MVSSGNLGVKGWQPGKMKAGAKHITRKVQPCLRYNRRRDRINFGILGSLYKEGGYFPKYVIEILALLVCGSLGVLWSLGGTDTHVSERMV